MKSAIVKRFIIVLIIALTISGVIMSLFYYRITTNRVMEDMKPALMLIVDSIDWDADIESEALRLSADMGDGYRITIIDKDGTVLADSEEDDEELMENHAAREEIKEAHRDGFGSDIRKSETLKGNMLYVAYYAEDHEVFIRVAMHHDVLVNFISVMMPTLMLSFVLALTVAGILANKFADSVARPLMEISDRLEGIYNENSDFNFPEYHYKELNVIATATSEMSKSVQSYIRKLEHEKQIRQEFFSNASHELKTPLTAIRGYSELLQSGMASNEKMRNEFLDRIHSEVEEMTVLINDILTISRLESNELMASSKMVDLESTVDDIKETLQPLADENHVTLKTRSCSGEVYIDPGHLQGILTNLISNAIKYNRPGGYVFADVSVDSAGLEVKVEDSGIGIAQTDQKRIFERFYRVDKGRSKKIAGTGLGLSIVKHVAEYYGGNVSVESQIGIGSTFVVRIPAASIERPPLKK